MKLVNFDFKITDLGGKPIEDFNTKEQVANIVAGGATNHPVRMTEIARKIYTEGKIELLAEDEEKVKQAILANQRISDLVKSQVLLAIENGTKQ